MVAVRQQGKSHHQRHSRQGAKENEGTPPPQAAGAFVRQAAKQGQQEQRQHVVRRHDHAGEAFADAEGLREDFGDQVVVHLPKSTDRKKGKADEDGSFGVELHSIASNFPFLFSIIQSHGSIVQRNG